MAFRKGDVVYYVDPHDGRTVYGIFDHVESRRFHEETVYAYWDGCGHLGWMPISEVFLKDKKQSGLTAFLEKHV